MTPNFPGKYPNNLRKTETIEVEIGKILLLEFTYFDVEDCGNITTCPCDFVKIRDGDGITLMDRSCGYSSLEPSHLPLQIMTRSNRVEIFFSTDDDQTTTGWSLRWRAVTPGLGAFNLNSIFIISSTSFKKFNCLKMNTCSNGYVGEFSDGHMAPVTNHYSITKTILLETPAQQSKLI